MEHRNEYEKYLRERLNSMVTKDEKLAYLLSIEISIDMQDAIENNKFNEREVVEKLKKELTE